MKRRSNAVVVAALVGAAAVLAAVLPGGASSDADKPGNAVLAEEVALELGTTEATKDDVKLPGVSGGAVNAALEGLGVLEGRGESAATQSGVTTYSGGTGEGNSDGDGGARSAGCPNVFHGHGMRNIRVNQDCSLRRQAEEVIAVNPTNHRNIVVGQNDSVLGFNHCGYDFSFNRGRKWGTLTPPFYGFLGLDGSTFDACSDPTATFDADGNAYIGGILFDIASDASALLVEKSNAPNGGAFYHTPRPGPFQEYSVGPGVVANDNNPAVFHDKEFIVADANAGGPKQNNVYATWTRFTLQNSPIFFSQSTDGGATWSPGIEISGSNAAICTDFSVVADACDQDQGSHPIVGGDGSLYVIFGNGNTPFFGINQVLFVKCPVGNDCSGAGGWSAPVKINDLVGLHPIALPPNNAAGCPLFRQCLPPNGYRVPEFTSMSISIDNSNALYAVWSDFRNGGPPCDTLDFATSTPPCDNDVFYSFSTDGGATWSPETKITPAGSAQWQPWSEVQSDGKSLWVAYYDRSYGDCETTGCNDITAAEVRKPAGPGTTIKLKRVTTSSMPNLTTLNNPVQAGFLGDYMWVDVVGRNVHIVWADTRPRVGTAPEEDIYYARLG